MSVVRKTLQENYIYFIRELARIDEEIKKLPAGGISLKKIGKSTYYYHQRREGKKVKTISLGANVPTDLLEGIKAILIGSYCLPVMKEETGMNLPTIKTQDIDFLINTPYKGKEADVESILSAIGFSRGFNSDGSTYFTNGVFKVEFLTPEKGRGEDKAIYVKPLKISASPLRYLQMLFDQPTSIEKEDYTYFIPNPWVLAYHKILVSRSRKAKDKKDKDMLQAIAILREVFKRPEMSKRALSYLETLPKKWAKYIKSQINELGVVAKYSG